MAAGAHHRAGHNARAERAERGFVETGHLLDIEPGGKCFAPASDDDAAHRIIGIRRCFGAVYSVEQLRYQPKPAIRGFLRVLRGEGLDPRRCIMVEDTLPNLMTAKRLGMKTVWVTRSTRRPPCVDVQIRSVLDLPGRLGSL